MNETPTPGIPILLVDDEQITLKSCEIALKTDGITNVITCQDSREVMNILGRREIAAVLLDLSMPHVSGETLLPQIVQQYPHVPVIIVTGANDVMTAVRCMREGAFDYMVKPVEKNRLVSGVRRAVEIVELQRENLRLKSRMLSEKLESPEAFREIVTRNRGMLSIFRYVEAISRTNQTVMITGETGVGKELMARAIHTLSRPKTQFLPVNVAGLDENMFADTLFGHRKGAFTGADQERPGLVEKAAGGTLFLDEIGDLCHSSQIKLLRLLQEKEFFPLGSDLAKRSTARIIVATNQNIEEHLASGTLRKDLYYRLRTHHIHIPPLRERKDDLPLLVDYFIEEATATLEKKKPTPPRELFTLLEAYHFPGNVRELRSMIYDAVSKHEARILSLESFSRIIYPRSAEGRPPVIIEQPGDAPMVQFPERLPNLKDAARMLVEEAMKRAQGNQSIAAKMLGITQQALSKRLKKQAKEEQEEV